MGFLFDADSVAYTRNLPFLAISFWSTDSVKGGEVVAEEAVRQRQLAWRCIVCRAKSSFSEYLCQFSFFAASCYFDL